MTLENKKEKLTPQQAKPKIEHFCNYQERCHSEVTEKLYGYGLNTDDVNELLSHLVKTGLLNEERFAKAYAGGKFRQKKWGRNKIIRELKARKVSDYCIRKGLQEIDDDDYLEAIKITASKYVATLKDKMPFTRLQKTIRHLVSKGFEYELCRKALGQEE